MCSAAHHPPPGAFCHHPCWSYRITSYVCPPSCTMTSTSTSVSGNSTFGSCHLNRYFTKAPHALRNSLLSIISLASLWSSHCSNSFRSDFAPAMNPASAAGFDFSLHIISSCYLKMSLAILLHIRCSISDSSPWMYNVHSCIAVGCLSARATNLL